MLPEKTDEDNEDDEDDDDDDDEEDMKDDSTGDDGKVCISSENANTTVYLLQTKICKVHFTYPHLIFIFLSRTLMSLQRNQPTKHPEMSCDDFLVSSKLRSTHYFS